MFIPFSLLTLVISAKASSGSCVGTISSLSDVGDAVQCTTVNIDALNVPAGQTFSLELLEGTTVNVLGDIYFGIENWQGPLFQVKGQDIQFNGNGYKWYGGGESYWDGLGGRGSTKPDPMMAIHMSGTFSDVYVVNSPERCFSINNPGALVVSGVTVDDSQGAYTNPGSNGLPAGHNTDGFDVSGNDVVIKNSTVINQDDCLAINRGKNILFEGNYCDGGHGVSIGSISSNTVVDGVFIQGNTIVNSTNGFRIKTDKVATNSKVSNVTYVGNSAINCASYGVIITQGYPETLGEPGNGVIISDISFSGDRTDVSVGNHASSVAVNCGKGSCTGSWDWSSLSTSGGKVGTLKNYPDINGYSL